MKKYMINPVTGEHTEIEFKPVYNMWPIHSDKKTQYRVVRMEDNQIKYERIFLSEKEATNYISKQS